MMQTVIPRLALMCLCGMLLLVHPAGCSESDSNQVELVAPNSGNAPPVQPPEPEPMVLRWGFADGDRFRWVYESGMEMEGPQDGELITATIKVRIEFDVGVESLAEENDKARMLFDLARMQVTSDVPGYPMEFDSATDADNLDGEIDFDNLTEEQISAEFARRPFAEFLSLQIETLTDSGGMIHELNVGGDLEELAQQNALRDLLFLVEKDGLNSLHAGGFVRLPEEEITPESVWEQSTDVAVKYGIARFTHAARYAGLEVIDGVELQRFDTSITSEFVEKNSIIGDLVTFEDGGGSGVLYFNHELDQLASYSYRSTVQMTMLREKFGAENIEATITYFSDTTVERIDSRSSDDDTSQ